MTHLRPVPDRPRRAIGYVRVSMAREEMVSPELQRTAIESYCTQRGYVLGEVISDLDQTGRNFARAGVQEAISRVERGEADVIVVWKVSRFGRNTRDWHIHADRVEVAGGSLESATEAFDPFTSTGKLTRGMLVELAAWESNVKSEQWKEAHAHRFAQGLPHTSQARFGYRYNPELKLHEPDPIEGPILAECYQRYIAGETPWRICQWLDSIGSRTSVGGKWTQGSLRNMLAKGFGAGLLYRRQAKTLIPGAHQPVIDAKTWAAYQQRRARSATEPARARTGIHPLSGLVVCATCDYRMTYWAGSTRGVHYEAYKCVNGCRRNYAGLPKLHDAVKAWLEAEVAADVDARAETKAQQLVKRELARSDRAAIERKIRELDKALNRLTDGYARGVTPEPAYVATSTALAEEKAGLEARLVQLADDVDASRANVRPLARSLLRDYEALVAANPAGMKEVLRALIREIRVEPGREFAGKFEVVPRWT